MSITATELEKMISEGKVALIEASTLNLNDEFMRYEPENREEKELKEWLSEVIKSGLKDFYRPVLDPSFNDDKTGICYEFGRKPAVGMTYKWWEKAARKFNKNCRLGTIDEYVAFLGVLIKKLIETGWSASEAWMAVCRYSCEIGNYRDSKDSKEELENTGSREVCGFYDLANTQKMLADFLIAGGYYYLCSYCNSSLADFFSCCHYFSDENYAYNKEEHHYAVGWLVIECS